MNLLLLLLTFASLALSYAPEFDYNYQILSLTWPQSFCSSGQCRHGFNNWDG